MTNYAVVQFYNFQEMAVNLLRHLDDLDAQEAHPVDIYDYRSRHVDGFHSRFHEAIHANWPVISQTIRRLIREEFQQSKAKVQEEAEAMSKKAAEIMGTSIEGLASGEK